MPKARLTEKLEGAGLTSGGSGGQASLTQQKSPKRGNYNISQVAKAFNADTPREIAEMSAALAMNEGDWGTDADFMARQDEIASQFGVDPQTMATMRSNDNPLLATAQGINSGFDAFNNMVGGALDWGVDRFGDLVEGITDSQRAGDFIRNATTGEQLANIPGMAEYFVPVLGEVKGVAESVPDLYEAATGVDSTTGELLENKDRAIKGLGGAANIVMSMIPGMGAVKAGSKGVARGLTRSADDVAESTARAVTERMNLEDAAHEADAKLMEYLGQQIKPGMSPEEASSIIARFRNQHGNGARLSDDQLRSLGLNPREITQPGRVELPTDEGSRIAQRYEDIQAKINSNATEPVSRAELDAIGNQFYVPSKTRMARSYTETPNITDIEIGQIDDSVKKEMARLVSQNKPTRRVEVRSTGKKGQKGNQKGFRDEVITTEDVKGFDPVTDIYDPELYSVYEQAVRNVNKTNRTNAKPQRITDRSKVAEHYREEAANTKRGLDEILDLHESGMDHLLTADELADIRTMEQMARNQRLTGYRNELDEFNRINSPEAMNRAAEERWVESLPEGINRYASEARANIRPDEEIARQAAEEGRLASQGLRDQAALWNERSQTWNPFRLAEALADARFGLGSSDAARMFRQGLMSPAGRASRSIQALADDSLTPMQRATALFTGGTPAMRAEGKLANLGENLAENIARGRQSTGGGLRSRIPIVGRGSSGATDNGVAEVQRAISEAMGQTYRNGSEVNQAVRNIKGIANRNNVNLNEFKGGAGRKALRAAVPSLTNTLNVMAETGENPIDAWGDFFQNASAGEKAMMVLSMLPGGGRGARRAMRSTAPFTAAKAMLGAGVADSAFAGNPGGGLSAEDQDLIRQLLMGTAQLPEGASPVENTGALYNGTEGEGGQAAPQGGQQAEEDREYPQIDSETLAVLVPLIQQGALDEETYVDLVDTYGEDQILALLDQYQPLGG